MPAPVTGGRLVNSSYRHLYSDGREFILSAGGVPEFRVDDYKSKLEAIGFTKDWELIKEVLDESSGHVFLSYKEKNPVGSGEVVNFRLSQSIRVPFYIADIEERY